MDNFTKIGSFGVDSGTVMIVDPCYVVDNKRFAFDGEPWIWPDFVRLNLLDDNGRAPALLAREMHGTQGVVVSTGYGDGLYPVYARIEDQRVMEIRILFDGEDANDE